MRITESLTAKLSEDGMPRRVHEILRYLQQDRSGHHADDRAFAATQGEAAEKRCRDGVQLIEVSMHGACAKPHLL
jgi:hypothetical protein